MRTLILLILTVSLARAQTTYYVNAIQGSDVSAGTSPASAWRSIGRVNAAAFSPGDFIKFNRGDVWYESLLIARGGTPDRWITYTSYGSGPNPLINGSALLTAWRSRGGNVWAAYHGTTLHEYQIFFDNQRRDRAPAIAALNARECWIQSGDSIYVYSPVNPASAWTHPGVEAGRLYYCIAQAAYIGYVYIDSIDCTKANNYGINATNYGPGGGNITVRYLTTSLCGDGILAHTPNFTAIGVHFHGNGYRNVADHGIYLSGSECDNFLIKDCIADSNAGGGIHAYLCGGGTIQGNLCYGNGNATLGYGAPDGWGIIIYDIAPNKTVRCSYNVAFENVMEGITVQYCKAGDSVFVDNNTVSSSGMPNYQGGIHVGSNDANSRIYVRNNLSFRNIQCAFSSSGIQSCNVVDHNCWYQPSGYVVNVAGTNYTNADWAAYQRASGFDANSVHADPLVAGPYDFALQAGSPCIDRGIALGFTVDKVGTSVPQGPAPDIGAFEYRAVQVGQRYFGRFTTP